MDNLDLDRVWACLFDREADLARGDVVPLSGLVAVRVPTLIGCLLSGVPEGAARPEQEVDLQISIGHALVATKGYSAPERGEAYARARQLCKQLDQPARI
jgi:hypothetical protein